MGCISHMPSKMYVGIESDIPKYESVTTTQSVALTKNNIDYFFDVEGGDGGNTGWNITDYSSGTIRLKPGNVGVNSTEATITLKAKVALNGVVVSGYYYTESNYDKITLTIKGTTYLSEVSGASSYTGSSLSLAANQSIVIKYKKDSSQHHSSESSTYFNVKCNNINVTTTSQELVGYEKKEVARNIPKAYLGISTNVPIKEIQQTTTRYPLKVSNYDSYYFTAVPSGESFTLSNGSTAGIRCKPGNIGIDSSNAGLTLTAKRNLTNVKIQGEYHTETNYDKITMRVKYASVLSTVSGDQSYTTFWTGSLTSGDEIYIYYQKDGSVNNSNEANTYFEISCDDYTVTTEEEVITGYEQKDVARKITKGYIGDENGKARLFFGQSSSIVYTGLYDELDTYTINGTSYKGYRLRGTGNLTTSANGLYWICGGGSNGASGYTNSGGGGAGGYVKSGSLAKGTYSVTIGAGGATGGTTSIGSYTAAGGKAPSGAYGGSGGTGGGLGYIWSTNGTGGGSAGTGAGVSTIPYGLSSLKAHCGGGGGGASYVRAGYNGGTNGGTAPNTTSGTGEYSRSLGGIGGVYGGGNGGDCIGSSEGTNGFAATFYGGGGGGAAGCTYFSSSYTGGAGYAGVAYVFIPV